MSLFFDITHLYIHKYNVHNLSLVSISIYLHMHRHPHLQSLLLLFCYSHFTIENNHHRRQLYHNHLLTHTILILAMVDRVDHHVSYAWLLFDIFAFHRYRMFYYRNSMLTNGPLGNPLGVVKFVFCVSLMHNCGLCYLKLLSCYFLAEDMMWMMLHSNCMCGKEKKTV